MDWTYRIRLRNLRVLLSLAHTQNLSRSAEALHMTQPGLSRWLKELESDVGLPLFERHARGLRPTPLGETLIAHSRRIDAHLSTASDELATMVAGGTGLLRVGTSGAATADTVPLAMLKLSARMPHVRVRIQESTMDRLIEQLSEGQLDIVVGRVSADLNEAHLLAEPLYSEAIHFVCRPKHPVLAKKKPSWEDVLAFPWVIWPKGTPIRVALEKAVSAARQAIPVGSLESNSTTVNLTLLNNSQMIGVASHRAALRFSRMNVMAIVPIRLAGLGTVAMYSRGDSSGRMAVAAGLAALRDVVKEFSSASTSKRRHA